jgi:hypothetical protein
MAAGAPAAELERLDRRARALLDSDGHHGALVHFLLHREDAASGPLRAASETGRADPRLRRALAWLHGHVQLFERGVDRDVPALIATLERLEQLEGAQWTLDKIDALLRADLSLVPLWLLRAAILERSGEPQRALRSLQWLPGYLEDDELLAEVVRLAAQHHLPLPAALLARFEQTAPRTPRARLAAGLLALRAARHAPAAELLAAAQERLDGSRQLYLALALLPQRSTPAAAQARAALDELAARYPTGAFAELAAHLARQLRLVAGAAAQR